MLLEELPEVLPDELPVLLEEPDVLPDAESLPVDEEEPEVLPEPPVLASERLSVR